MKPTSNPRRFRVQESKVGRAGLLVRRVSLREHVKGFWHHRETRLRHTAFCFRPRIGDGQFVARRPVGVFGCFGVGGLGELLLQSTVIAYWFKVVLAMMWKPVTTSGSMATTVSA